MRYGHFDDPARENVIERPDTPRSWTNYLGSTEYGAIITNHAAYIGTKLLQNNGVVIINHVGNQL